MIEAASNYDYHIHELKVQQGEEYELSFQEFSPILSTKSALRLIGCIDFSVIPRFLLIIEDSSLQEQMFRSTTLLTLELDSCRIESLDFQLTSLEELIISDCLQFVVDCIYKFKQLTCLKIINTELSCIDIKHFEELEHLSIEQCSLSEITNVGSLKTLILSSNNLSRLNTSGNFELIDISNNLFEYLDLSQCKQIAKLYINNNPLILQIVLAKDIDCQIFTDDYNYDHLNDGISDSLHLLLNYHINTTPIDEKRNDLLNKREELEALSE